MLSQEQLKMRRNGIGLCACGCGLETCNGSTYRQGHWAKANKDKLRDYRYKGSRVNHGDGYFTICPNGRSMLEHRAIAEKVIGFPLPPKAVIHHVNGDRSDNRPSNLVICEDRHYHSIIHQRQRAYEATGNAESRICQICSQYDLPENLYIAPRTTTVYHKDCYNKYKSERKKANANRRSDS